MIKLLGYRAPVCKMKKILEISCETMSMYWTTHLKIGKIVYCCYVYLTLYF